MKVYVNETSLGLGPQMSRSCNDIDRLAAVPALRLRGPQVIMSQQKFHRKGEYSTIGDGAIVFYRPPVHSKELKSALETALFQIEEASPGRLQVSINGSYLGNQEYEQMAVISTVQAVLLAKAEGKYIVVFQCKRDQPISPLLDQPTEPMRVLRFKKPEAHKFVRQFQRSLKRDLILVAGIGKEADALAEMLV
jgi:hypothetical protein